MLYKYNKITIIIVFLAFQFFPPFISLATETIDTNFLTLHSIHPASFPIPVRDDKGLIIQGPNIAGGAGPCIKFSSSAEPSEFYLKVDFNNELFKFNKDAEGKNIHDELVGIDIVAQFFQHRIPLKWDGFITASKGTLFEFVGNDIVWRILSYLSWEHPRKGIIPLTSSCKFFKKLISEGFKLTEEEVTDIRTAWGGRRHRFPHSHLLISENFESWNERRPISPAQQIQLLWSSWCGNAGAKLLLLETVSNVELDLVKSADNAVCKIPCFPNSFSSNAIESQSNLNLIESLIASCGPEDGVLLSHLSSEYLISYDFTTDSNFTKSWGRSYFILPRDRTQLKKIASYLKNCIYQHDFSRLEKTYTAKIIAGNLEGQFLLLPSLLDTFLMGDYDRPNSSETGKMRPRDLQEKKDDVHTIRSLMSYWKQMSRCLTNNPSRFEISCFAAANPLSFAYIEIFKYCKDKDRSVFKCEDKNEDPFLKYLGDMIP
jgi:hypothetical protein